MAGMELTRLTVIDWWGSVLIDELVKPTTPVLDLNTRFSGVASLETAKLDLEGARKAVMGICSADTVFIGHGLENDLNALRILHTKIIDTSILFPHNRGLPYRYSLRILAQKLMGRHIQQSGPVGHDALEDSKAALDLVKLKLEKGDKMMMI
ncbi:RNA exonuclease 3 [Borealophlyctis nickersoniae]|nr:RNA exonuclease 3 [Borealophlyctis nickersoniae]